MMFRGYELITEWKNSNCGQIVRGKKGSKTYFIKKYQTPVHPVMNGALDAKTYDNNKRQFDLYVKRRSKINSTIRLISGEGGNIIIPNEEFVEENHYVEASEFVSGVVSDEELEGVLSTLSTETKKLLMLTAAGALASVHAKKIVHSDLKLKNVLLVKNPSGNYVAKLIDFDNSYMLDDIPDPEDIGGSIDYCSPELAYYSSMEEDWDEQKKELSEKSDIFSLGLIFHFYLAGELPKPKTLNERLQKRKDKGKAIYCWEVLANDCEIELSDKITNLKYRMLIQEMLQYDHNLRPTALQVLQKLKAPDVEFVVEEPWEEHRLMLNKDAIKGDNIAMFKKLLYGGKKEYDVVYKSGSKVQMTADQVIAKGYATVRREERLADAWPEHSAEFDKEKLKSRGFVASEQKIMAGIKGYDLFRADGSFVFFTIEKLLMMGYAKKVAKPVSVPDGFCTPWPEHNVTFDIDVIKAKGYVHTEQATVAGVKGYNFFRADGSSQFMRIEIITTFRMAKKN